MSKPKFKVGDLVHINKEMPDCMSHFQGDMDAIVTKYSHNRCQDESDSDWAHSYVLFIKGLGNTAWYYDFNLRLLKHNQMQLIDEWKADIEAVKKQQSDLDWIFNNGTAVLKSASGASVGALAKCLGCSNLWGSHGEGFMYYLNAMKVLSMAKPFLEKSDKAGWLKFSKKVRGVR